MRCDDASLRLVTVGALVGVVSTVAGSFSGYDDGVGTNAIFYGPSGVSVDSNGVLYIADTDNTRIRKQDVSGSCLFA